MATITNLDIKSKAYAGDDGNGTINYNEDWGVSSSLAAGSRYFVYQQNQVQPSIRTDGKVGLSFTSGICGGWGIWDYFNRGDEGTNTPWQVEFDTVTSDTWFLVSVHRKWGAYATAGNQETTVSVINAGSSGALPAVGSGTPARAAVDIFNVVHWDSDDQPLALAKVSVDSAGTNRVTSLRDLRVVGCGGGIQLIYDRLAMQYLGYQGTQLLLWEDGVWNHVTPVQTSAGQFSWLEDKGPFGRTDLTSLVPTGGFGLSGSGWSTVGGNGQALPGNQIYPDGNRTVMNLRTRRTGATISTTSTGNFNIGDSKLFTISDPDLRPDPWTLAKFPATYKDEGGATHTCFVYINADGEVWLDDSAAAGVTIPRQTGNEWSVALHAEWTKVK